MAVNFAALAQEGAQQLLSGGIEEAPLEARLLLKHVAEFSSVDLIAKARNTVSDAMADEYRQLIARRLTGEPVHRIMGYREFYGRKFLLSADTLEPRADTEILVEAVLKDVAPNEGPAILDIGTGSGAIIVSLLAELANAKGVATDILPGALKMAAVNAKAYGVDDRLDLIETSFSQGVKGEFDLVVSNPPYISENEYIGLQREVRDHDPKAALIAGESGLEAYQAILEQLAGGVLKPGGVVYLELGHGQVDAVCRLAAAGPLSILRVVKDLSCIDRVLILKKNQA